MSVIVQGGLTVIGKRRELSPNIITDGLVLHLDAGNTSSYPGTGTDWFDLTGNGNNGTLTNGVTYLTDNGGIMSFDGINDYVYTPNTNFLDLPNNTSMEFWVNSNSLNNNDIISHRFNCYGAAYNPTWTNGYTPGKLSIYYAISGWKAVSTTTTPLPNTWYHLVGTYDGTTMRIYLNGVLENTRNVIGNIAQNEAYLGIGTYTGAPGTYAWDGKIPIVRYYHKTLTDNEVLQNYNALKTRFGL
jgi:hypothetical protein